MRGLFLLLSMIFFASSMYLFYNPELLQDTPDGITGQAVVDDRPLIERITASIHKPVSIEETVQMAPVILLFLSVVFAFASVLMPDGER